MKKLHSMILLFCMVIVSVFNSDCSKQTMFNVKYQATVYDRNGVPVDRCKVTLSGCEPRDAKNECNLFLIGQAYTDKSGMFTIKGNAARSKRYWVSAGGYFKEGLPKEIHLP